LDKSSQDALRYAQGVQKNFDQAKRATTDFFGGVIAGAASAALAYVSVTKVIDGLKASIEQMDSDNKLAQKIGISTDAVQKLSYVGALADVSVEGLAMGFKALSTAMTEAYSGSKEQQAIFDAIGVSVRDANGNMRDSEGVFGDIADVFAGMEDGAAKTALAVKLFGKSGMDMIPALNAGKEGLKQASEEAEKYGLIVSGKVLPGAEEFNDNLTRLGKITQGTFNQFAEASLPVLGLFSEAMVESASGTDSLNREAQNLKKDGTLREWAVNAAKVIGFVADAGQGVYRTFEIIGKTIGAMAAQTVAVMQGDFKGAAAIGQAWKTDVDAVLNRKLFSATLNEKLADLDKQIADQENKAVANAAARKAKAEAIQRALAENKSQGGAAGQSDFDRLNKSLNERLALSQAQLDIGRPLTEVEKQRAKLLNDYEKGLVKLTPQELQRLQALMGEVEVTDRLNESRAAAAKMEAERVETARKEIAAAFEAVDKVQQEVDTYGMLPSAITAANRAKLEQRKISLELSGEALPQELAAIEALIEANRRLEGAQGRKEMLDAQKQAMDEAKKLGDQRLADEKRAGEELERSLMDGLQNGFQRGMSLTDIFINHLKAQFAKTILSPIIQPIAAAGNSMVSGLLGSLGGLLGIGGAAAGFGQGAAASIANGSLGTIAGSQQSLMLAAQVLHTGGMAHEGARRSVDSALFSSAPRYHTGALAGDEVPAILQRGEGVFTKSQMRNLAPVDKAKPAITVAPSYNIAIDGKTDMALNQKMIREAVAEGNAKLVEDMSRAGLLA